MEFRRRYQKVEENFDDLLVFGYPCTIFRDDERATWIENGEHLIISPNDGELTIDRFDCRLLLTNSKQFDKNGSSEISAEEEKEKILLDEERYKDLREEEEKNAKNDEMAQQRSAAIGYDYGTEPSTSEEIKKEESSDEEEEPFVPSTSLKLPPETIVPSSVGQNLIIEKTAAFVASQGPQMEIIINAKQKANRRFRFLDYDNPLNKYYKHVLKMIREKKYTPSLDVQPNKKKFSNKNNFGDNESDTSDDDDDGNYLHPSLMAPRSEAPKSRSVTSSPSTWPAESSSSSYKIGEEQDIYSELYNRLSVFLPQKPPEEEHPEITAEPQPEVPQTYGIDRPTTHGSELSEHAGSPWSASGGAIVPPPPDLQPIIDRLAEYVARNGSDFEMVVRSRRDDRFHFLEPTSVYYPYYRSKIGWFQYEHYMSNFYHGGGLTVPAVPPIADQKLTSDESARKRLANKPLIDHPWCTGGTTSDSVRQKSIADSTNEPKPFTKSRGVTISFSLKPKDKQEYPLLLATKSKEEVIADNDNTEERGKILPDEEPTVPSATVPCSDFDVQKAEKEEGNLQGQNSIAVEIASSEPPSTIVESALEPEDLLEANNSSINISLTITKQNERRLKARLFLDSLKRAKSEKDLKENDNKKRKIDSLNFTG